MDSEADKIIEKAAKVFTRTEDEKFSNYFLEQIYQSIIPVNKLLKWLIFIFNENKNDELRFFPFCETFLQR